MGSRGWDGRGEDRSPRTLVRELTSGVDALYVSGRAALDASLVDALSDAKQAAAEDGHDVGFNIGGTEFGVAGHGLGKYRFCLHHRHGLIGLSPGTKLPAVRIQPRTEFLHALGPLSAVEWFVETLGRAVGPIRPSVSRLDLHCDVQGWLPSGEDRQRFLCRATTRALYETHGAFAGFQFGRRTSKTISARIYDKTRELGDDLKFWPEEWGDRFDPSEPVLRVEFELGRTALAEYGIDSPQSAVESAGGLWSSLCEWLSFRVRTGDETHSRWPVAPEWEQIRRARIVTDGIGLERAYGSGEADLDRLCLGAAGYLAAIAARIGTDDVDDTAARVPELLRHIERKTGRAFAERIADKRRRREFE